MWQFVTVTCDITLTPILGLKMKIKYKYKNKIK